MDGFSVLRAIRNNPRFANMFLVALSGYELSVINKAYQAGAHSYLIKPPNPVDIVNLVRFFHNWKRPRKENSRA